jgi:putative polyketide hydroxylase
MVDEVPVLIAGAGPAGLTAAITLARYGIEVLLVERRDRPSSQPKATVISTRSMELIRSWGLEPAVHSGGVDAEPRAWSCVTLADAEGGVDLDVGYPTRLRAAAASPTGPACVPQDHLERVLRDHLRTLPSVRVRTGVAVVDVDAGTAPIRVMLGDGGRTEEIRARYVIGAEGARSVTRAAVGIAMTEPVGTLTAVRALFRAPLWDVLGDRRYAVFFTSHPDGAGTFLPAGGDRWVFGVIVGADPAERARLTSADLERRLRAGSGVPDLDVRIEHSASFESAAHMADRFRRGRVFLAGDAAHRVTPRGGTGMNMAMHGAFDLAWKLAWVLRGWAHQSLLDSYESEQRPRAAHHVARSADPNGAGRDTAIELSVDLGGRLGHAWIEDAGSAVSTVDLVGPGLTLFSTGEVGVPASPVPVEVHRIDAGAAAALGLGRAGSLLVRPDGRPVAVAHDGVPLEARIQGIAGIRGAPPSLNR